MARPRELMISFSIVFLSSLSAPAFAQLSPDFYTDVCPQALHVIRLAAFAAIAREPRMGASLLRLHLMEEALCMQGCDASVLLDDTPTFTGEKTAGPNNNSLRGFDAVDEIKAAVNYACNGNVVSCADILAVAARDSVIAFGGKPYEVLLGRRDARTASLDAANKDIPAPSFDLPALVSNFDSHGLSLQDLVVLSGAHTLGFARCAVFRQRIYNDSSSTIDPSFARDLQEQCPPSSSGDDVGDGVLASLDDSPARFDATYFDGLRLDRGLLHSDQQLFSGDVDAKTLVSLYSEKREAFWEDFGAAMVKMGSLYPVTGDDGEIRENCRFVNDAS